MKSVITLIFEAYLIRAYLFTVTQNFNELEIDAKDNYF
jgi:hypothetical protein